MQTRLLAFISFVLSLAPLMGSAKTLEKPELCPCYQQTIRIQFRDKASADNAEIAIEPLYNSHRRAVSCRWDDNWTSDNLTTRDVMEEYGIKGTWYLNGHMFSPEGKPADYSSTARQLLKGGNSVGGHSLTHPYITYFHSNRMFAEMSGVRIDWESILDKPLTSYAYSFVDIRPEPEGRNVMLRTLVTLDRAGIYHVATYDFFKDIDLQQEFSPILPPENNAFDYFHQATERAYGDQDVMYEKYPMISNSMHAWYGTFRLPYGYDELRKRLELLSSLEDVWHCNQNEYAAYRRQKKFSSLTSVRREGRILNLKIDRPTLLSLNDDTPVTISITSIDPKSVEQIDCETASIHLSDRKIPGKSMFHIQHDQNQALPMKIGYIANPKNLTLDELSINCDPDFPNVSGALSANDDMLSLRLKNSGASAIQDLRVHWRSPIGWEVAEVFEEEVEDCASQETLVLTQGMVPVGSDQHRLGLAQFVAQVDFTTNGKAGRIHFSCQKDGTSSDNSYPQAGFSLMGPIPNEQIEVEHFANSIVDNGCPETFLLAEEKELTWRKDARDGYITHEWLNPEYIRTMGTWDHISQTYLLRSKIYSEHAQEAKIILSHSDISAVVLNGQLVVSDQIKLNEGENEIFIIYPGCQMSLETQRLAACFLRLANPQNGQRLQNIRYEAY